MEISDPNLQRRSISNSRWVLRTAKTKGEEALNKLLLQRSPQVKEHFTLTGFDSRSLKSTFLALNSNAGQWNESFRAIKNTSSIERKRKWKLFFTFLSFFLTLLFVFDGEKSRNVSLTSLVYRTSVNFFCFPQFASLFKGQKTDRVALDSNLQATNYIPWKNLYTSSLAICWFANSSNGVLFISARLSILCSTKCTSFQARSIGLLLLHHLFYSFHSFCGWFCHLLQRLCCIE